MLHRLSVKLAGSRMSRLGRILAAACPSLPSPSAASSPDGRGRRSLSSLLGGGAASQAGLTAHSSARLDSKRASSSNGKRLGQSFSKFPKRPRASHKVEGQCAVEGDTSVMETEEQHTFRHPRQSRVKDDCSRCAFMRHSKSWHRIASFKAGSTAVSRSWLSPKPSYMGGQWGLGCLVCAAALAEKPARNKKASPKRGKWQARLRASKWARFRVTRLLTRKQGSSALSNHLASAYHRKAVSKFQIATAEAASQTESPPGAASLDATLPKEAQAGLTAVPVAGEPEDIDSEATALLKGRVPQLQDWTDAWASASSTISAYG